MHTPCPKSRTYLLPCLGAKLDLQHEYLQVVLEDESKPYTVINTHHGLFQYNRLPFGVSAAPGIFQRVMDSLVQGMPHVAAYLDDIAVTGASEDDHLKSLDAVLQRLETACLRLKKHKCVFMASEINYLEHRITKDSLQLTRLKQILAQYVNSPSTSLCPTTEGCKMVLVQLRSKRPIQANRL